MVVQFVAFLGAYRNPGTLDPWMAAVLASLLVTWVTFVPSILFVLLGAPYMERLRGNRLLSAALTGITAAVVGVIANLGVYFAIHTLFTHTVTLHWAVLHVQVPDVATFRPVALGIAVVAAVLLFWVQWSVLRTLGVCAALGLVAGLAGLPIT
jgi:chromate transporter